MKTEGYSIKDLETLSGVKAHTIRIWEKRYELLHPKRTDTNIRFYTDADLKRMLNISLLVRNGYKISKVAKWREDDVKETVLKVAQSKKTDEGYVERLLLSMVNFDNLGFNALTNDVFEQLSFEDAIQKVFFALFERIGIYWQIGSIFPAQEHFVSHLMRQKIIAAIDALGGNETGAKSILFYLPEEELHELSLLFYSYLATKAGFNVIYLGQLVPFEDLEKLKKHIDVDFVFTAFINSISKKELENYLVRLKELYPRQKVFITGWQVNQLEPSLPRNVKAVKDFKEFKKFFGIH